MVSLILIVQAIGVTDLSQLVSVGGLYALADRQLLLYGVLLVSLLAFALCISRKSHLPAYVLQTQVEKRKLQKRTIAAAVMIVLLIPLTLFVGVYYFDGRKYGTAGECRSRSRRPCVCSRCIRRNTRYTIAPRLGRRQKQ